MLSVLHLCFVLPLLALQPLSLGLHKPLQNTQTNKTNSYLPELALAKGADLVVSTVTGEGVGVHVDNVGADIGEEGSVMRYQQDSGGPTLSQTHTHIKIAGVLGHMATGLG